MSCLYDADCDWRLNLILTGRNLVTCFSDTLCVISNNTINAQSALWKENVIYKSLPTPDVLTEKCAPGLPANKKICDVHFGQIMKYSRLRYLSKLKRM